MSYSASGAAPETVGERETTTLIAAGKVNGTSVYNARGDLLGSIYDVMIDKRSGQVSYAVMAFGGFLGIGERYHPLPWHMLTYDEARGGYVVDIDRSVLEGAPSYAPGDDTAWASTTYSNDIDSYYAGQPAPI